MHNLGRTFSKQLWHILKEGTSKSVIGLKSDTFTLLAVFDLLDYHRVCKLRPNYCRYYRYIHIIILITVFKEISTLYNDVNATYTCLGLYFMP